MPGYLASGMTLLEASFIVFRTPPFFSNIGKRLVKSPGRRCASLPSAMGTIVAIFTGVVFGQDAGRLLGVDMTPARTGHKAEVLKCMQ